MAATGPTKPMPIAHPGSRRLSFDDNSEKQFAKQFTRPPLDFDPCANAKANAKITSPFYLYNHESPRPSTDSRPRPTIHVSVKDLEAQTTEITPTPSRTNEKRGSSDSGKIKLWSKHRPARCMTKKKQSRWKSLLPWQRLLIKIIIGLLLTGMIVGVAVGISMRVHGGVYKSNNETANIA